jgi:tetratricopeptide (TPR) repeat protein
MNKFVFRTLLLIGAMFVLAGNAGAQSIEEAHTEYAEGRFVDAADLARALDTSDGYALAADSLVIYGYYIAPGNEKEGFFRRAVELARTAIRLDPANPDAHLQLAHAMGRRAQAIGVLEALHEGYAGKMRNAVQEALRLAPDMAAAHLSFAAWHAGVINNGGLIAALLYGASEDEALAHFERAVELAPQEKVVFLEYALGLLSLDAIGNGEKARNLLKRAISLPSKDALDRIIHRKAIERLAAFNGK